MASDPIGQDDRFPIEITSLPWVRNSVTGGAGAIPFRFPSFTSGPSWGWAFELQRLYRDETRFRLSELAVMIAEMDGAYLPDGTKKLYGHG